MIGIVLLLYIYIEWIVFKKALYIVHGDKREHSYGAKIDSRLGTKLNKLSIQYPDEKWPF